MERFTERDEYGNADIIALSDMMPELYAELSFSEANALTDALNRLADYEDSGLTPQEIRSLQAEWNAVRNLVDSSPITSVGAIDRGNLINRIYGPDRPEINDGAEEVDWIIRCIKEAPDIRDQKATGQNGSEGRT